jgi:hypothetical protein
LESRPDLSTESFSQRPQIDLRWAGGVADEELLAGLDGVYWRSNTEHFEFTGLIAKRPFYYRIQITIAIYPLKRRDAERTSLGGFGNLRPDDLEMSAKDDLIRP